MGIQIFSSAFPKDKIFIYGPITKGEVGTDFTHEILDAQNIGVIIAVTGSTNTPSTITINGTITFFRIVNESDNPDLAYYASDTITESIPVGTLNISTVSGNAGSPMTVYTVANLDQFVPTLDSRGALDISGTSLTRSLLQLNAGDMTVSNIFVDNNTPVLDANGQIEIATNLDGNREIVLAYRQEIALNDMGVTWDNSDNSGIGMMVLQHLDTTIFFQDQFVKHAGGVEIDTVTPEIGIDWTKIFSSGAGKMTVTSSNASLNATGGNTTGSTYACGATYPSADYEITVEVIIAEDTDEDHILGVRLQDVDNAMHLRYNDSKFILGKRVTSTFTENASVGFIANGNMVSLRIEGTKMRAFIDGGQIGPSLTIADAGLQSTGKGFVGVGNYVDPSADSTDQSLASVKIRPIPPVTTDRVVEQDGDNRYTSTKINGQTTGTAADVVVTSDGRDRMMVVFTHGDNTATAFARDGQNFTKLGDTAFPQEVSTWVLPEPNVGTADVVGTGLSGDSWSFDVTIYINTKQVTNQTYLTDDGSSVTSVDINDTVVPTDLFIAGQASENVGIIQGSRQIEIADLAAIDGIFGNSSYKRGDGTDEEIQYNQATGDMSIGAFTLEFEPIP